MYLWIHSLDTDCNGTFCYLSFWSLLTSSSFYTILSFYLALLLWSCSGFRWLLFYSTLMPHFALKLSITWFTHTHVLYIIFYVHFVCINQNYKDSCQFCKYITLNIYALFTKKTNVPCFTLRLLLLLYRILSIYKNTY